MNKKSWLIVGLSLAMAASIGVGISACGGKEPDTPEHTHEYTKWEHSETQHWMVCPADDAIWAQGKVDHIFTNGTCECGMKEADVTPDEGLDTRVFYVVGSGAGDLSKCSFTELKSDFKLTKQPKKDENGYTVYTTAVLTLYSGDTMKIVQDLDWDDGLGYFGVSNIKNNDGSLVDGGGPGNITPAVGKDGKYRFTVRTKPDIAFSECTLEFEFIEPVEPLKNTAQIYIVGNLKYYKTQWPGNGNDVSGCLKLNHDETTGEWSIVLRLGGKGAAQYGGTIDEFKLYNSVNRKYYPDGTGNNWTVNAAGLSNFNKESGDYKISWKPGDTDITFTLLPHEHNFDDNRMARDENQHWAACWLDDTQKPDTTRENHIWENDEDTKCDKCGYVRHIHKYDTWDWNEEEHWKYCKNAHGLDKSNIDESTRAPHTIDPETHKCECGYEEHTHEYTKWEHDAKQHWKACPKDNEPDPETPKAPHSFDPVTHTCECGYEHTHTYTRYNYNDKEHWKECPTDDVIDEETRTAHDFTNGDCECGMKKPDCEHSNGYAFDYKELPAAEADGGTLEKICPDCKGKQTVPYLKGFTADGDATSSIMAGTVGDISEEGTYYFTNGAQKCQTLGLKINGAGTYTISFEKVFDNNPNNEAPNPRADGQLSLDGLAFGNSYATMFATGSIMMGMIMNPADLTNYAVKVNEKNVTAEGDLAGALVTFSFTVTEEQLQAGDLYVTIQIGGFLNDGHSQLSLNDMSYLATVTKSAAATTVAPAEVALLPGKED